MNAWSVKYFFKSVFTLSFWRYALFSGEAIAKIFALMGLQYTLVEAADFFSIYAKDQYSGYAVFGIAAVAIILVVATRRPITAFRYRVPGKDLTIEVRIGDLFQGTDDVIVGTNRTFDTDMAGGLIDTDSVQGQVATRFFNANTNEIDQQLASGLVASNGTQREDAVGNDIEYPIGTVAIVRSHNRIFYFVAMARLGPEGNASSSPRDIEDALEATWNFVKTSGRLSNLAVPLLGTARGRTGIPRKKMVERIAQSFIDASKNEVFSNRLSIFIRPEDAENSSVNLYEVRDLLVHGLHS